MILLSFFLLRGAAKDLARDGNSGSKVLNHCVVAQSCVPACNSKRPWLHPTRRHPHRRGYERGQEEAVEEFYSHDGEVRSDKGS